MPKFLAKPAWPLLQRGHRLASGLVAAWPFTEGSGAKVYDTVSTNTGTIAASGPARVGGPFGNALKFSATSNQVSTPIPTYLTGLQNASWTFHINLSSTADGRIVGAWGGDISQQQFLIYVLNSGQVGFAARDTNFFGGHTNTTLSIGTDYVVTVVVKSPNATSGLDIYFNGVLQPLTITDIIHINHLQPTTANLQMGLESSSGNGSALFTSAGLLIHARTLTVGDAESLAYDMFRVWRPPHVPLLAAAAGFGTSTPVAAGGRSAGRGAAGFTTVSPGSNNIYFAGGEDVDFTPVGATPVADTTAGHFRSAWARCGTRINADNGNSGFFPPTNYQQSAIFGPTSSLWFHAQFFGQNNGFSFFTGDNNQAGIMFGDGTNWRLAVRGTGGAGQFKLSKRNAAGTVTDLSTSATNLIATNALTQIDIKIVDAVAGSFAMYLNGSNTASWSFSGDLTTDGIASIAQMALSNFMTFNASLFATTWSEVIVSSSDTRPMGLFTLTPQANGNTQVWSGTVGNINEAAIDDTTLISALNAGDIAEFTCPTAFPTGTWDVDAVVQSVRGNRGLTGPQHIEFAARPAGAGDNFSADVTIAAALANYQYVWGVNPATGLPWTVSALGTGFNLGIKATT